jgi:tetratricopeptide (TPR) repeat protein
MGIGLVTKAEEQFLRAAADEKYSSRELPYYNLARISFSQDKLDEALDYVQKSIELNRRLAMAHNLRGFILEKKGLLAEAIESYKQAAKIVPDEVNFSYNLAVAYFNNNELAKAQEIFEQILDKAQEPEMKENIQQYLKKIKKQP